MKAYSGRIIKRFKVLEEQYEYLRSLAANLNEETFRFLVHVVASTLLKLREEPEDRYSPICIELIRGKFGRNVSWRSLRERRIIDVKGYSRELARSRKFKLTERVIDELLHIAQRYSFEEPLTVKRVNLMTGKPTRLKLKNVLRDDNRNEEPTTYINAVEEIRRNGSFFNYRAVAAVTNRKREKADKLLAEKGPDSDEYLLAHRQWQNDYYCFLSVLFQNPVQVTDSIWRYEPAYRPAKSGRAQQIGGGFQSASVEVKAAAVEGLDNFYNYDLEASQPNALRLQFQIAGRNTDWLNHYLSIPNYKEVYAAKAELSKETWKTCVIALIMGATMPKEAKRPNNRGRKNSVLEALWKEAEGDLTKLKELLARFTEVVQPLVDELELWHTWLIEEYIPNTTKFSKRGAYIVNDVGKRLYLNTLPQSKKMLWKKKAKVVAFILQGTEANFIHRLTTLGPKYGYRVIGNEHDGVLCLEQIPEEAVSEVVELTGFRYAKLVVKPFKTTSYQSYETQDSPGKPFPVYAGDAVATQPAASW